ncbi:kinase-like domain-containing protein [Collybia nuda]|uniref:Kinase-like domain-containing protein n=1 Tax=Collybia nuda TaxID=64659 RepID=A0A9P5XWU8_9AGAR|nr:kinase-like domain-containing protein [Collybia nuda]
MHILNINPNILKFESLLEQISRWRLPPDLYDAIILSLQSTNSVSNVLEVRIHPNSTSIHGHASSHPDIPKYLLTATTIGLAIISITTMSLFISIHSRRLQSHHVAAATLNRGKRKINRTSLRENRQPSEKYYGLAVTIMICSYLLWVFGTLHATSRFLWTLARNLSYTIRSTRTQRSSHVPEFPKAKETIEESRLGGISNSQAGQSWLPIELSGVVFNQLDSTNIIGARSVAEVGFGRLYQAVDARSGNMLAIKRVINRRMLGEDRGHLLLDEIRAHHRMNFDSRFPPLLGCFIDQRDYVLVMFLAIRSLHKARIIHGDLKPENILLDENKHLIIMDFYVATVFSKSEERGREYPLWQDAKKRGGSH